jgi:hypothetical protein
MVIKSRNMSRSEHVEHITDKKSNILVGKPEDKYYERVGLVDDD